MLDRLRGLAGRGHSDPLAPPEAAVSVPLTGQALAAAPTPPPDKPPSMHITSLPDTLLESIFELLDAHTLLQCAAPTCRRYRGVAQSETLWLARLPPALASALRAAPSGSSGPSPASSAVQQSRMRYHALYCSLANANLLANPWFSPEEQLASRRSRGGDAPGRHRTPWLVPGGSNRWGWGPRAKEGLVVAPGADRMPPPPPSPFERRAGPSWRPPGAVASSYSWTALLQEVDLVEELRLKGLPKEAACAFLDSCPALALEFHVAGRFDCHGWFEACLVLDGRSDPVPMERQACEWQEKASGLWGGWHSSGMCVWGSEV